MDPSQLSEIVHRHRAEWLAGQPFVVGVLGDFSRRTRDELPPVAERRFRDVRLDTVDALMAALVPIARVEIDDHLTACGRLTLDVEFRSLADFEPDAIVRRVPLLAAAAAAMAAIEPSPLRADREQVLGAQLSALLQSEPVRALEASWRSLHRLLVTLPDDIGICVRVLDLSHADLRKTLKRYRGTSWDLSPIAHLVLRDELGTWGGRPFNLLLGDYDFSGGQQDARCLLDLGAIAYAAGCVFIAAAAPRLLGLARYAAASDLRAPRRLFEAAAYQEWRALRSDSRAEALSLVLPRVLARAPHWRTLPSAGGARFVEDHSDRAGLTWAHAVYALGARLVTDIVVCRGDAGLPDAPTGGVFEASASLSDAHGEAVEGRFASGVTEELADLGLVVVEQQLGSRHLHYATARSLAGSASDGLCGRILCGRLLHGLHDLARRLRGIAWTERDYEQAMREWVSGLLMPESGTEGAAAPPANRFLSASLTVRAVERLWGEEPQTPWTQLRVELSVDFRPLRPGRSERCTMQGIVQADGGRAH